MFGLPALILLLLILLGVMLITTSPTAPDPGSQSAAWLDPGLHPIASSEFVFVDDSRPTAANGEFSGTSQRTFQTTLWYPTDATGAVPLVVHSHGLVSSRNDLEYLARHLASHGYVVAAADFPLTHAAAPGGPEPADVVNQPADVSFLIDSVLSLVGSEKPFPGLIDLDRIGLMGYSLGGLTTVMATFHPRLQDSRVAASVSIAGPSAPFGEEFYQNSDIPFLAVAGSADALVDYSANAAPIPDRVSSGDLVTVIGGTHLGFAGLSEPFLRFFGQPDSLGCNAVLATLDGRSLSDIILIAASEDDGIVVDEAVPGVCDTLPTMATAHPGRQQMITSIAVLSFFESVFALQPQRRLEARTELAVHLGEDFVEAMFTD